MALVVADRVQETSLTSGTGTLTLAGAVSGYQTFSTAVGNGNTTFYTIYDPILYDWEVGIGTVGAGTLTRTTVLSNSAGTTSLISFASNAKSVFCTYPADKSVNLNALGNVSPLGTISSGTWNGSTIGVTYGGTGVTTSSGANSVVLRDANQNVDVNRLNQSNTNTTAAGSTTALTTASSYIHSLNGTGNQTYTLPDATTLSTGVAFVFNNLATGTLTIQDFAAATIGTIPSGGAGAVFLTNNATVGGTWDLHAYLPEGVTFGTNAFNLGSAIVSGGTWQGGTIGTAYGGTGLTTFSAANYALYSTNASTLTAGTLPTAAGGTGQTSYINGELLIGNSTGNTLTKATLTAGSGVTITNGAGSITIAAQSFVAGMIMLWSGSSASIPSGWLLCDGTNATPDLRNRFVVGAGSTYAVNATGGSADAIVVSHTHTATVTDPGHSHTVAITTISDSGNGNPPRMTNSGSTATSTATTGITVSNSTTGSSGTNANLPPYYALCYIMKS